jgi:hypothetical protein
VSAGEVPKRTPPCENTIILGMEATGNTQEDVDWDSKTLVDDESNADSMAPMELEEYLTAPVLYCAFCKWGDEEAGPLKRKYIFSSLSQTLKRSLSAVQEPHLASGGD